MLGLFVFMMNLKLIYVILKRIVGFGLIVFECLNLKRIFEFGKDICKSCWFERKKKVSLRRDDPEMMFNIESVSWFSEAL